MLILDLCALSLSEKGKVISDVSKNLLHEHLLRNKIDAEIFQLRCGHWNVENNLPKQFPKVSVFFYGEQPRGKYHPSIESNIEKMLYKGGVNCFLPEDWSILTQKSEFNTYNQFCLDSFESEIVVFINPLVEPMHPAWLDSLVSHCLQENVGFCGPRLVHPATSRVISAGMVMEREGVSNQFMRILSWMILTSVEQSCNRILSFFIHAVWLSEKL